MSPPESDDAQPLAPRGGLSLRVVGPAGTASFPLPATGDVVIGRGDHCDVQIDDGKLSRRHVTLRMGPPIELVDLGSLNGTIVHDARLPADTPTAIAIGDAITIGGSLLILQRATHASGPRQIWSHSYFEAQLAEACARAAAGGPPFAVFRLRLLDREAPARRTSQGATAADELAAWLDDRDVVATYAPGEYEVLLIDAAPEHAAARTAALSAALTRAETQFRIGTAMYPRDGRTPEVLVERTSRLLAAAAALGDGAAGEVARNAIEGLDKMVERVAAGVINVLILGETGVGKDVLARRIHALSPRASQPFVSINCAAISESLLESEFFGHERGAFTGAVAAKPGLLESAHGGTVFLDEIGEMPGGLQAKLLRVLEQREVTRVGAVRPRSIDVRFIAATNRDLELAVAERTFRQDLYFRLNGIALSLPPLRERVDEIAPLATAFVAQACRALGRPRELQISREAIDALERYAWPGNIRELRNMIERAVLLCSGPVITSEQLPLEKLARPRPGAGAPAAEPAAAGDADDDDGERQRIIDALDHHAGNQSHAAKALGISRGTLIKRIDAYGLRRPRKRS